jgi:osmotically-inducible protein OsmY
MEEPDMANETQVDADPQSGDAEEGPHRGRGPQGWKRSDARLHEEVCETLSQDHMLDAGDIEVEVSDGVVTLSGSVPEATDVALAGLVARSCAGVIRVDNRLQTAADHSQADFSPEGSDHAQTSNERFAAMGDPPKTET